MASPRCWRCKAALDLPALRPVGRSETCPECDSDLRVCRACAHFRASLGHCNEPTAEPPGDLERANFCQAFTLAPAPDPSGYASFDAAPAPDSAAAAKARLEALFKGSK